MVGKVRSCSLRLAIGNLIEAAARSVRLEVVAYV